MRGCDPSPWQGSREPPKSSAEEGPRGSPTCTSAQLPPGWCQPTRGSAMRSWAAAQHPEGQGGALVESSPSMRPSVAILVGLVPKLPAPLCYQQQRRHWCSCKPVPSAELTLRESPGSRECKESSQGPVRGYSSQEKPGRAHRGRLQLVSPCRKAEPHCARTAQPQLLSAPLPRAPFLGKSYCWFTLL